ncbi:MAG TPA: hypothetical protein VFM86_00435 [Pedococcus sp.]|nr:hypothetical protein [Pedococcus sp.]
MAPKIKVEIAQLDLAEQVLDRQRGHMDAAGRFVQANCRASGAFTGVLGLLEGHYSRAYDAGTRGMSNGSTIADTCATLTNGTRKEFIARDRAAYEAMAKKGVNLPPYEAPTGGTVRTGAPLGPGIARPSGGTFLDGMKQWKTWVENTTHLSKPAWQNPRELWRIQQRNFDATQRTDPKYWIQRGLDRHFNALTQRVDGMSPTELGTYLRNRQRDYYSRGQDFARRHPILDNDSASRSPAAGAVTASDAGRLDTLSKGLQAPAAVLSEGKDVLDAAGRLGDTIDQTQQVNDAVNGPKNDGGITWAKNHKGGTW